MNCKTCEKNIMNDNLTPDTLKHIETCQACRIYYKLNSHQSLQVPPINNNIINYQMDLVHKAVKRKAYFSQALFSGISLIILSILAIMITQSSLMILAYLMLIGTFIMPISLPIIGYFRRRTQ